MLVLAWKNLARNWGRTVITISAIFFAVILSVATSSLRAGIFENLVDNITRAYTGKIQIHATGYWGSPSLDKTFLRDPKLERMFMQRVGLRAVLPRLEAFALVASGESTKGGQLIGIDPNAENNMSGIRSRLTAGHFIDRETNGLLVSEGMLRRINARVDDTIVLLGQGFQGTIAAGKYPVVGSIKLGSPDLNDHLIYMPLPLMQELMQAPDRLTAYVLDPFRETQLEKQAAIIEREVRSGFEVMTWSEMLPDIKQHIETDTRNMRIVQWVLYLLVGMGILGTFLMLMSERLREFGMLLALGMQKIQLIGVLICESMFVFALGVGSGLLVSVPIIRLLHEHPIRIGGSIATAYERFGFEAVFPTAWNARYFWEQGATVLCMGLILSVYFLVQIFRLDPVRAMR